MSTTGWNKKDADYNKMMMRGIHQGVEVELNVKKTCH